MYVNIMVEAEFCMHACLQEISQLCEKQVEVHQAVILRVLLLKR